MQSTQLYEQMKSFLEGENACRKTLSCLDKSAQIDIEIGGSVRCSVQYLNDEVVISQKKNSSPDLIFYATPMAVEILIAEKDLTPAGLGIKLLKQLITGQVRFTMPANLFHILRKGYLDIVKVGGKDFLLELKKHNLASPSKIISALKKMKK